MAADVLTYNALQEINQKLKAESAALSVGITSAQTASGGGGGGGGANTSSEVADVMPGVSSPNGHIWCMIPRAPDATDEDPQGSASWTSGFKTCDDTGWYRCGRNCTWYVPGGATKARFQIWGSGGSAGSGCCCGGSTNGGTGAYASVTIPVQSGWCYNLCSGCAYCCYVERTQSTQDGYPSYVQGCHLTNFCAEGGESNRYCEMRDRCHRGPHTISSCKGLYGCICNTGTDYCSHQNETPGVGYPNGFRDAVYQPARSTKTAFGTSDQAPVYIIPGQWSYLRWQFGNYGTCFKHPGVYGFPDNSCCCSEHYNEGTGCCYQACYCSHKRYPGLGSYGYSTCGGDTSGCSDVGSFGMVCVSYC